MKKLYSYKLESHPEISLISHLQNVGDRCADLVRKKNINFSYSKEILSEVAKVMGYTHDFGKGTHYFQKYLSDMNKLGKSDVKSNLKSHGYLSAVYAYIQIEKIDKKLALISFMIVRKHHGDLENYDVESSNFKGVILKKDKKLLKEQIEALDKAEIDQILKELHLNKVEHSRVIERLDEISDDAENLLDEIEESTNYDLYVLYKFLYSILIFADKEDAIFHESNNIDFDIPNNIVDLYKEEAFRKNDTSLGDIRNEIYDEVCEAIEKSNNKIMSITVPTGTGKTLTAMSSALKLRKKLNRKMKIIYCLPFTSVIDQNYEVYSKIIKTIMGESKLTNDRILKHHHLSDITYNSEKKIYNNNESKFLTENWNSEIIVTTFIQFFNCIFSNRNGQVIKYNSIADSIVLLDEIQSVPHKYWLIINEMFKVSSEKLNIYFILITATQPLIFDKGEIKELVEDNKRYFKEFKRTKLHINLEKLPYEEFKINMEEMIVKEKNKNILIILNTVKLAQDLYDFIKNMIEQNELENVELYFLSTGIVPIERKNRIDNIKDSKKRKIVVSTQLIEAGVDIDMDIVVRDMATLDSINQSAGRCNREYRGDYLGDVYLFNLVDNNSKKYNGYVYDKFLINKTEEVLKGKHLVYEEDYLKLNNEYFNAVKIDMSNNESRKLINLLQELKFKDIHDNFKLIDEQNKVSIFIECDDKAREVWKRYKEIVKQKDNIIRKQKMDEIKMDFYNYVINVFKNKVKESEEFGMVYIPYEGLRGTYDKDKGYLLKNENVVL